MAAACKLELPERLGEGRPARGRPSDDPQTLLVIGTDGVRAVETDCLVSSYRVPSDGAVVVVIGWRDAVGASGFLRSPR